MMALVWGGTLNSSAANQNRRERSSLRNKQNVGPRHFIFEFNVAKWLLSFIMLDRDMYKDLMFNVYSTV